MQEQLGEMTTALHEGLAAIRVIKIFGIQREINRRFEVENRDVMRTEMRTAFTRAINSPVVGVTIGLALVAILMLGGQEIQAGRMTGGELMAFVLLLQAVSSSVNRVSRVNLSLQRPRRQPAVTFLEVDDQPARCRAPIRLRTSRPDHLRDVSFSYLSRSRRCASEPGIEPREIVAFTRPSGAGKTTIESDPAAV